jgi:hypothetical protein
MNPRSCPYGTPKTHFVGVKLPSKPSQAVERLLKISDELIVGSGLDDHVIHVGFNVVV